MPMTDIRCPNCRSIIHTDCLLDGECTVGGCGHEFEQDFYDRHDVIPFYRPEGIQ